MEVQKRKEKHEEEREGVKRSLPSLVSSVWSGMTLSVLWMAAFSSFWILHSQSDRIRLFLPVHIKVVLAAYCDSCSFPMMRKCVFISTHTCG